MILKPPKNPSTELVHGPKVYFTKQALWHKVRNSLPFQQPFVQAAGWYGLVQADDGAWWIWVAAGCRWDGASCYPDWAFMLFPSLIHDLLHWLIMHGVLHPRANNLIDKELGDLIRYGKTPIAWWLGGELTREIRARWVERATRLVDQKRIPGGVEHRTFRRPI